MRFEYYVLLMGISFFTKDINDRTIFLLVGHGLENDFRALMLVHTLVIDTSDLYPHFFGLPYRRSLKSLAKSYLKRDIQTGTHDSLEDARASLELVLCQVVLLEYQIYNTSEVKFDNPLAWHFLTTCIMTFFRSRLKKKECQMH